MYIPDERHAMMYDAYAIGMNGDVQFYAEEARKSGGPVLELACGTGRVLIPIAQAEVETVGLDISPHMLAVARKKVDNLDPEVRGRIQLVEGDMGNFSLDKQFKLVVIPFRSFLALPTPEDQRQALGCIREHLDYNGRLIINTFDPRLDLLERRDGSLTRLRDFTHPVTGRNVVYWESTKADLQTQMIDVNFIFEEQDEQGYVVSRSYSSIVLRWIYRYEMQYLLELSGFKIDALYGDFQRGPFRYGGEQIWVASKS